MNDKKFEALRKKLDVLGFPQTLNPDSFQLVDKMYNQLFKCMTELDQQRKKKVDRSQSNADSILLYDRIDSLTAERDALKKQLEEARSGSALKQNDERIRNLTLLVNNFKVKQQESMIQYERQVKGLSNELASLTLRNEQLQKECQLLRQRSSQNNSEAERYAAELTALLEKKGKEIRQLQDTNSKLRIRVQVLQRNLEDNNLSVRDTQHQTKQESQKLQSILKQELAEAETRYRQVKTELEETRDENQNLRREIRRTKEEIIVLKREETNTKNLQSIGRVGKQKVQQLYQEAKQQLADKIEEQRKLQGRLEEQERQRNRLQIKLKQIINKNKFLTEQNADLQTQIEHISSKSTLQIKRVRELQASNVSLQKQLKQVQVDGFSQKGQLLQQNLRQEQAKAQQLRKDTVVKEREIKLLEDELKVIKNQAQERAIERDKAHIENRKLQTIIAEGSRNLQALQLQKEELMKENRELRSGKQMLTSADSMAKSELFVLKQRLQASQGQVEELRSIIHSQQLRNKQLQSEIGKLQSAMHKNQEKNVEIFQDNRLMANQIKILEQRKNELHEKVKQLQQRAHMQMEGNSEYRRQFDELLAKNQELQRQLARKDKALKQLDIQKDQLQTELDQQTLAKSKLRDQIAKLESDVLEYSRALEERQYSIHDLQKKLSRSQDNRQKLERQHERLVEEQIKVRDRLMSAETQLKSIHNELSLLVISNQQAQREADRSKNRIAELDKKLKERNRENQDQRERATAMNILSNELQAELERERAESVRLRGFVGQLEQANNHMYQQLENKDQELEEMSRIIQENERREEQYIHQINSYQRQLQNVSQDFQSIQDEVRRLNGEKETLRAQRNWKKEVSSLTQDWRTKQEERFVELQNDYHRCKLENEQLRHRCRDLQDLLSQERAKNCRASQQSVTPCRPVLVQSRVESYHEGQNFNNSNVSSRSRNQSMQQIDLSHESVESEIVQSAKYSLMQIERKYQQTSFPSMRPGRTPNS